ncbi:magnesium transporter CorA family protein [Xanthobacter sediminis]|uniref:magnesium transporter CorA family protein n=1 Tax=Xanthobacter sediminis TaxID=3119926 RepID=UPI00372A36D1
MIIAYVPEGPALKSMTLAAEDAIPPAAVWIDLLAPEPEEAAAVERLTRITIPTRKKMREIEPTSRLFVDGDARFMTAALLCGSDTAAPSVEPATFILTHDRLISVRYTEPRAFVTVAAHLTRSCPSPVFSEFILIALLEAIVDQAADILEQIAAEVEDASSRIFSSERSRSAGSDRYRAILAQIARAEGVISFGRESLASLQRLLSFLGADPDARPLSPGAHAPLKSMTRDIAGLSDYAAFLGDKVQFLLDATIGMVGIEQNNIMKIFAVLTLVLTPPTLISSIYGMNFAHMPELQWPYAYPLALLAMLISGILPYLYFKQRGWF